MHTIIYGLVDPSGELRYIGRTGRTVAQRLREHIKESLGTARTHKTRWLRDLIERGMLPSTVILLEVDGNGAAEEIEQLRLYKAAGYSLVNATEGGDGHMIVTPELRAKLSAANKGRRPTKRNIEAVIRANTGRIPSAATRHRLSISHAGHTVSQATRDKIGAGNRGRKPSASNQSALAAWRARGRGSGQKPLV